MSGRFVNLYAYVLIVLLSACSAFGLTKPQTFNQELAYAYSSVSSIRMSAASMLKNGSLTVDEAQNIQDKADLAKGALDSSRTAFSSGDITAAEGGLLAAQSAISALQSFLNTKGVDHE